MLYKITCICNFRLKIARLTRLVKKGLWEEHCEQETEGLVGKLLCLKMQKLERGK